MNSSDLKASSLALYTRAAQNASDEVIRSYSTSFGWASRLLAPEVRVHVRNIYALVRVADEIVDGAAAEALSGALGVDPQYVLDNLERETYKAIEVGFSANLVVHAFAHTARAAGIERAIIQPFFHSMRMDIRRRIYDKRGFDEYVYGSAEVVGLMCLRVFLMGRELSLEERDRYEVGARALGAAFQKVNFLRDLKADFEKLGRSYFPLLRIETFNDAQRDVLVDDIRNDLQSAKAALRTLPRSSRRAVAAALWFFYELNQAIAKTPAAELLQRRIRVNNFVKTVILIKAAAGVLPA